MATEINNLVCTRCREPIPHAALQDATVKLEESGVVLICPE